MLTRCIKVCFQNIYDDLYSGELKNDFIQFITIFYNISRKEVVSRDVPGQHRLDRRLQLSDGVVGQRSRRHHPDTT